MARSRLALLTLLSTLAAGVPATADAATTWLCRPGMANDACAGSLSTTRFTPAGKKLSVEAPKAGARKIDCFYVYPTVSDQKTAVANKRIDPELRSIALYQAARYTQECRVFAPVYRQRTIQGIQPDVSSGTPRVPTLAGVGYTDVREAWRTYLKRYNKGRGVVLIGHSQGTFMLRELVTKEIDGSASARRKLVSALLLGGNVTVKKGSDVGGDFQRIRACRAATQLGCVVAFSVYDETPPVDALFGGTLTKGQEVLCTNPGRLSGGAATIDPISPSAPFAPGTSISAGISLLRYPQPAAATRWISAPGSFTARCSEAGGTNFLQVSPRNGAPNLSPSPSPQWGLHLVDANLALGNLVELVRTQAAAYAKRGDA